MRQAAAVAQRALSRLRDFGGGFIHLHVHAVPAAALLGVPLIFLAVLRDALLSLASLPLLVARQIRARLSLAGLRRGAGRLENAVERQLPPWGRLFYRLSGGRRKTAPVAERAASTAGEATPQQVARPEERWLPEAHRQPLLRRALRLRPADVVRFGGTRLGRVERAERLVPVGVAGLLFAAAIASAMPAIAPQPVSGRSRASQPARIISVGLDRRLGVGLPSTDGSAATAEPSAGSSVDGPYLPNGTLVNPWVADTQLTDASGLLKTYTVLAGDTLSGIAAKFGISTMTLWWANKSANLTDPQRLRLGQRLAIPPVDGVLVTVQDGDTLESLSSRYGITTQAIVEANDLADPVLVAGQVLILPDAHGDPMPTAKPTTAPAKTATKTATTKKTGGSSGGNPPPRYGGGRFAWPVIGGHNYISQYFSSYHPAIDIAAQYGSPVVAAAAGTVIFAGWRNNGGGYQVWIAHGSGLYTTYNHMSAVLTGAGRSVGRGQRVGSIGMTGSATGPHLHFEVWIGYPWNGGSRRVNPLGYL